jgi:hypothetical protein
MFKRLMNRKFRFSISIYLFVLIWPLSAMGHQKSDKRFYEQYANPPLMFIENLGQLDSSIKYYERGMGHTMGFTPNGIIVNLLTNEQLRSDTSKKQSIKISEDHDTSTIKFNIVGIDKNAVISADQKQTTRMNYLTGQQPKNWRTNIATYRSITYSQAYPGVDIRFYGNHLKLEYDVILAAGADLSGVRFQIDGIEDMNLNSNGDLVLQMPNGRTLTQKHPFIFQEINGEKIQVTGQFKLYSDENMHIYGFDVEKYNQQYPLIIDPIIQYSTFWGGNENDLGNNLCVDSQGNIYIVGTSSSGEFPESSDPIEAYHANEDVFIAKFAPDGQSIIFATYLGGSGGDFGSDIAVDDSGIYIVGNTSSTNFPLKNSVQSETSGEDSDIFLTKLSSDGTSVLFSTYYGGYEADSAHALAIDSTGNMYVVGETMSTNYPYSVSFVNMENIKNDLNGFITKMDPTNSQMIYSTFFGVGTTCKDVVLDNQNNVYLTGSTVFVDQGWFPLTNDSQENWNEFCSFIMKINAAGTEVVYSTIIGGGLNDFGEGIAVDQQGNAIMTGYGNSEDFPLKNQLYSYKSEFDAFIVQLSSDGSEVLFSTFLGGTKDDMATDIALDQDNNIYITGKTDSIDFPMIDPVEEPGGLNDVFITKVSSDQKKLSFSSYIGGTGNDEATSIHVISSDNIVLAGVTEKSISETTHFFPTVQPIQENMGGKKDAFILKLVSDTPMDNTPPTLPGNLISSVQEQTWTRQTQITISWAAANDSDSGVAGYSYQWDAITNSSPDLTVDTTQLQSISPALSSGNTHYFHIRTIDKAGNASQVVHSGPFYIDIDSPDLPQSPFSASHNLNVCSTQSTIDIQWSASNDTHSGIAGYAILWDTHSGTIPSGQITTTDTQTKSPQLNNSTSHYIHIRAVDRAGNWTSSALHYGPFCIERSQIPDTPTGLTIDNINNHTISLNWNDNMTSVSYYNIYRGTAQNACFFKLNPTGLTISEFKDTGLNMQTEYWYKVSAVTVSGDESPLSLPIKGKTEINPVFQLDVLNYQEQFQGVDAVFQINVMTENNFTDTIQFYLLNVPDNLQYQFDKNSIDPSNTGQISLSIFIPQLFTAGNYQMTLQAIGGGLFFSKPLYLKVIPAEQTQQEISIHIQQDQIRLGDTVTLFGRIVPFHNGGLSIHTKFLADSNYSEKNVDISNISSQGHWTSQFVPTKAGTYQIYSQWKNSDNSTIQSQIETLTVYPGLSYMTCGIYGANNQPIGKIEKEMVVYINGQLSPQLSYETLTLKTIKPDKQESEISVSTSFGGKFSYVFLVDSEGEWQLSFCWGGNNDYEGCNSSQIKLYPGLEVGNALIVSGGGFGDDLSPCLEMLTRRFYSILLRRHFSHEMIYYISPGIASATYPVDDNFPEVNDIKQYLESLYPEHTSGIINDNKQLIIYLADHGGNNKFLMNSLASNEKLSASDLDQWLDIYQQKTGDMVIVIVESCYSGSFIDELSPAIDQKRIIITSTEKDQQAIFDKTCSNNFSQYFFNFIESGENIKNSFQKAKDKMMGLKQFFQDGTFKQFPQILDAMNLSQNSFIAGSYHIGDAMPSIEYNPTTDIHAGLFPLNVIIHDAEDAVTAWANIIPPNFIAPVITNEFSTPVWDLDTVQLNPGQQKDEYFGTYNFLYNGIYTVTIFARDSKDKMTSKEISFTVSGGEEPFIKGDINFDQQISIQDAIIALKIICGLQAPVAKGAGIDQSKIGLSDTIFVLRKVSESLRTGQK